MGGLFALSKRPGLGFIRVMTTITGVMQPRAERSLAWKTYQLLGTILVVINFTSLSIGMYLCFRDMDNIGKICFTTMSWAYIVVVFMKFWILVAHTQFTEVFEMIESISMELECPEFCAYHSKAMNGIKRYGIGKVCMEVLGCIVGSIMYCAVSFSEEDLTKMVIPGEGWLPYDPFTMPNYPITVVAQYTSYGIAISRNSVIDTLFLTCVIVPGAQLRYLRDTLVKIFDPEQTKADRMGPEFAKWAATHQKIIKAIDDYKKIGSYYLMVTYASVMFNLFLLGVMLTTKTDWDAYHKISVTPTFIAAAYQLYLLCAAADSIQDNSEDIANQSTTLELITNSPAVTKNYLVMLTRASTPIQITSAGIYPLSASTYSKLVNATFSFFVTVYQIQTAKEVEDEK